jgi:hypothetical protein
VTEVDSVGEGTVLVRSTGLRVLDVVSALDDGGIAVTAFRGTTFEDTYLGLFHDRAGTDEPVPHPEGPAAPGYRTP